MCLAQIDCEKSDVNTCVTLLHRVRLGSGLTGSSLVSVDAKPLWFVAYNVTVCLGLRSTSRRGMLMVESASLHLLMLFHRFRVEMKRVFFAKCFCQVALPCHPT